MQSGLRRAKPYMQNKNGKKLIFSVLSVFELSEIKGYLCASCTLGCLYFATEMRYPRIVQSTP